MALLVLGIATLRARVLPRRCDFALIGAVVVSIFGAILKTGADFVVVGLIWMALAHALWSEKSIGGK